MTQSRNPGERNFTLGQDKDRFEVRLRTTQTSTNGIPALVSTPRAASTELTHVSYTWSAREGKGLLYVNGQLNAEQAVAGTVSNWDDSYPLALANELTGDRPWRGAYRLVAIYSRDLSSDEVARNHAAGAPGSIDYAALLPPSHPGKVDFLKDILPLLRKRCFECHSAGNEEGGVNLGIRQRFREGGDDGPLFAKGDSTNSRLIHLVAAVNPDDVMPPDGEPLSKAEVGLLRAWIDQGAAWPDGADVLDPRTERAKTHWAFQPLKSVAEPAVGAANWPRTPIDHFIQSRQEAAGVRPANPASARRLIRRVSFDLIGLPPTPEEVHEFTAAASATRRRRWWIGCWRVRIMANAGAGTGWMSPATPTATARKATAIVGLPIATAISSFARSTQIAPSMSSSAGSWRATSMNRRIPKPWPPPDSSRPDRLRPFPTS